MRGLFARRVQRTIMPVIKGYSKPIGINTPILRSVFITARIESEPTPRRQAFLRGKSASDEEERQPSARGIAHKSSDPRSRQTKPAVGSQILSSLERCTRKDLIGRNSQASPGVKLTANTPRFLITAGIACRQNRYPRIKKKLRLLVPVLR